MSKNTNIILLNLIILTFFNYIYSKNNINSYLLSEKEEKLDETDIIKENQIINAIYVIRIYNGNKNLDIESNNLKFVNNPKKPLKKHFRIYAINKDTNMPTDKDTINPDDYYCIEDKDQHKRIGITNEQGDIGLYQPKGKDNLRYDDNYLWKIFPKIIEKTDGNKVSKRVYYYLQNKGNGKFLSYNENDNKLKCDFNNVDKLSNKNYFIFNKMYREKLYNESLAIIDKEPIDVLIKYIDLSDPNLKREGIKQIQKDEDNGEIRYCVRSILKNIPWIRKIFILMPNEKVKYFKEPKEIKDKIIYVKDKDLIGFDSASSPVFQLNLWKMQKFGLSENFILMDDDYFIGKPLEKRNFFYEENGKVYPASITGDYYELSKQSLEAALKPLLAKIGNVGSHTPNGFTIMQKSTLLFLYKIFGEDDTRYGKPLIESAFSHNAIPVKQSDIKEIYDYIEKLYPYADETLRAKVRHIRSLQPQTLFLSYEVNKYDRRVKIITSRFYDLTQFKGKIESDLFVINTSDKKYGKNYYQNEIKYLDKLFPDKSPYESNIEININQNQNTNKKDNKDKKDEKKKEVKNDDFYGNVMNYLKDKLNEKNKYNINLKDIKKHIDILNEKFDKEEKQIEEMTKKINDAINKNVTLYIENTEIKNKHKFFEIFLLIIVILCFVIYLYRNGFLSERTHSDNINYYESNGFGNISKEKEMNLLDSKLAI